MVLELCDLFHVLVCFSHNILDSNILDWWFEWNLLYPPKILVEGEICFENNPDSRFKAGIRRDQVVIFLNAAFDVFDGEFVFGYIKNHDV